MPNNVKKNVKIINVKSNPIYLDLTNDPKDTQVVPPKGTLTLQLTMEEISKVKAKGFQVKVQ